MFPPPGVLPLFRDDSTAYTIRHHAARRPVPRDRAFRDRLPAASGRPCDVLGAGGQPARARRCCSCTAAPAPAPARCIGGSSIRHFWRVVIFDQRGAGRSRPLGGLERQHDTGFWSRTSRRCATISASSGGCCSAVPGVRRWRWPMPRRTRTGWSAACCAASFCGRPRRSSGSCMAWRRSFPDAHATFRELFARAERGDLLGGYLRRLTDPDPAVHHAGGARLVDLRRLLQHACCRVRIRVTTFAQDRTALGLARIEAHYFAQRSVPAAGRAAGATWISIAQDSGGDRAGPLRHDLSGRAPPSSWRRAWPAARLTVVPDAGHSALEPGIRRALVAAVERFRARR